MRKTLVTIILLSVSLGTASVARAQPILERLEQKIRQRLGQATDPASPAGPTDSGAKAAARAVAEQPGAKAGKQPGYLGLVADDAEDRGRGVRVLDVRRGGPGEKAGFQKQDLITGIAGVRIRQLADMADVMDLFFAGDSLDFDVLRGQESRRIKVTLDRRPAPAGQPAKAPPPPAVAPAGQPAAAADSAAGPELPPPEAPPRPPDEQATIEQLRRRVEELERRVTELERALAEALKK